MMRDFLTIALDATLISASCAGSYWLDEHKELEPDHTWLEVCIGVGASLLHATLTGALHGGDWKAQSWRVVRSFALSGTPIICGELRQAYERRAETERYILQRQ